MNYLIKFYSLFGKNFIRQRLLEKTNASAMRLFLSKPFPTNKKSIYDVDIVSLDLETTGLDPTKDKIISIGLVSIENLEIKLASCWHQIIQAKKSISEQSVVIHQITDDKAKTGMSIEQAIPLLLERLAGKVILVHNGNVEQGFINKICQALYDCDFVIPIIDTQVLAKRSLDRRNAVYKNNDLRLFNLRRQFKMPDYKAHNALMDAIATAELFLAMVNEIVPNSLENKASARLGNFLS